MKTLKRLLTLILITTLAVGAWAERVSQEDAATVANNFMNASTSASGVRMATGAKRMVLKKAAKAEENQFYVYENADGEGWVMVAANDVVQPILAYSKTGQFNVNNQPSNVKVWLGGYNKQIKFAEENNVEATEDVKTAWKKLRTAPPVTAMGNVVVAPLIKTTWDQDDPYWKYCPKKGSTNTYVGCVATAMAQVMNYWKWPDQGEGSYSYTSGMNSLSCSANFGSTTYDWANMIDHYTTYYSGASTVSVSNPTTAQKDAVATLMYHCGVAVEMDYGTSNQGGSGAQTIYPNASQTNLKCAANALWNNFRYKKSTLKCYYRPGGYGYSPVNDATWLNLLKTELNAARPIMYAGADNEGGHSFVCDGYDDQNYFHFNWGWSGYCDGYYTVNNMVPGTGGSGAGNGSYNDDQDIIIGIIPDKTDITITWSVQGNTTTTTQTTGTLVLPATTPSDCSGSSGKKFVGWTANSTITGGARPADLFTSGSGITVTENKTYYAVYATASGSGGGGTSGNVTITTSTANIPTSYGSANTFTEYTLEGYKFKIQQMYLNSGKLQWRAAGNSNGTGTMYNNETFPGKITSIVLTYNSSDANKNFTVKVGNAANPSSGTSITPTISGSVYTFDCSSANADYFVLTNGSGAGYLDQIVINYGGGGGTSYSDYSLVCGTPCSNTPSMSFTNETVNKTTADVTYTQAVTITGKGSGQTVAYSSSDESVATVNSSGVVTLQGIVGSTTITASVLADGDYCAASASYTLNVTAAPIDVTLYYNGTSASLTNQTNPYTLPTGSPYNTAMCSGDWTFAGWYGSAYTKSTDAPAYITQLTATGSAYAVYTTTESSGSGGTGGSVSITTSTDNIPTGYGSANTFTEYTFEGYKFKVQQMYLNSGKLQWRAAGNSSGTGTMYNNETFPGKITSIVLTYNSSDANKNFTVKVGDSANPSSGTDITPSISGSVYTFDCSSENADYFVLTNGSGAGYLNQIDINYGGGGSSTTYYATSPDCVTPCSITPTMSFTNETVNKTTAETSYTQTVNIENKGSGQTVAYGSSDETVATVNNSGVVTLQGKVGSTTITASVEADGDYCASSASYTLNVSAAPIDVTLYYNGTSASLTNQTSPYTLPTGSPYNTPMCSGDWTFVGWYGSTYSKSTTAPTCITQLTASGSAYAVYTTTETSGGGSGSTVTLNAATDTSFPKDGITLTTSNGDLATGTDYRIYKGATLTITSSVGDISSIEFTFSGSYNGGGWATSYTPNSSSWTSPACTSGSSGKQARITQIVVTIGSGGGSSSTTYYATSPDCVTPCSINPTMSFTNETVNQTTAEASYTQAVSISGKGSGQTVAYSSSDETVATVNNSGVVTLLGKVGSTTITASVEADGDYCAASASYTLNVTAAPIDVTLYYNGTSASLTNQTNPYTLPTGAPYNTAMCGGDWTFAGWYGSAYTKSTDAPAYLSQLTATGSAYAVYTTTETSGGGSGSTVTLDATTDTSFPKDGITLTTSSGVLDNGTDYRIYKGATLTITSTVGDISSIEFTFDGSYNGGGWETSYTPNSSSWTSPACTSGNSGKQARITQIVVTIGSGGGGSTTYYATSPDCTPTTTYTVTWKACGAVFKSETYAEGAALVLPDTAPEDNAGKSFVGWTTTEHYTGASAPALISAGSAVNANATYYAVFH